MPDRIRTLYVDPNAFEPRMFESPALDVTVEQRLYIKKVLSTACSDTRFAQKAYDAIIYILTNGSVELPFIESLNPVSVRLGEPSFTLHVIGTEFNETSQIIFNGSPEATTFVSATELTTEVNMATAGTPVVVGVEVRSDDDILSNTMTFEFLPPVAGTFSTVKTPVVESKPKVDTTPGVTETKFAETKPIPTTTKK